MPFDVWNTVGEGHKEGFYQKAVAKGLKYKNIVFREQIRVRVKYRNAEIGIYVLGFLIEDKIILEIKKREYFSKQDINQLYAYLRATKLKLGIIAYFTKSGVKFKRVLNIK